MKILKKKIIFHGIIALVGIALFIVNIIKLGNNKNIKWLTLSFTAISIRKLIQFIKTSKNPQMLKEFEIQQKEERFNWIYEKSGNFTYLVTILAEVIAMFILALLNQEIMVNIVGTIVIMQEVIHISTYYYLCKKY
ncbi:hypothetical protein [Clostridium sp. UBA4548]|uniref:hypothetical protein n=1 Tax=Clostridium sp. UBA4548 TaxID=1946361 RepID=UPI0025BE0FF8|nr:hypothetical protein [Clostridium sp. UBA4548]